MKKGLKKLFVFGSAIALLCSVTSCGEEDKYNNESNIIEDSRNTTLEENQKQLNEKISELEEEPSKTQTGFNDLESKLDEILKALNDAKTERDSLLNELNKIKEERESITNAQMACFQKGFEYEGKTIPESLDLYTSFSYALGEVNVTWKSNSKYIVIDENSHATAYKAFDDITAELTATYEYKPEGCTYPIDSFEKKYNVIVPTYSEKDFLNEIDNPFGTEHLYNGSLIYIDEVDLPKRVSITNAFGETKTVDLRWFISKGTDVSISPENDKLIISKIKEPQFIAVGACVSYWFNARYFSANVVNESEEAWFKQLYDGNYRMDITGYVIAKGGKNTCHDVITQEESEICNLFIASDIYAEGAYYLSTCDMSFEDYDALEVGDYIKIKDVQFNHSYGYRGVVSEYGIEKLTDEEVSKRTKDITNVIANAEDLEELRYLNANRVTIKNAKVKAAYSKLSSHPNAVLDVEVGNNTISLVIQYGMLDRNIDLEQEMIDTFSSIPVGTYIDVEGLLYYYYFSQDEKMSKYTYTIILENLYSVKQSNNQ